MLNIVVMRAYHFDLITVCFMFRTPGFQINKSKYYIFCIIFNHKILSIIVLSQYDINAEYSFNACTCKYYFEQIEHCLKLVKRFF